MALVASKPGEQTVSSSSTTSGIAAMSSSASEPLTISSPSQVTQSPPVRKVNQRLVANKSALRLLSKTINLGKSRLVHNEILEPKVRGAERLVPPMRRFWEDAGNKQKAKLTCSRSAFELLQKARRWGDNQHALHIPDPGLPDLQILDPGSVFEMLPTKFPMTNIIPMEKEREPAQETNNKPAPDGIEKADKEEEHRQSKRKLDEEEPVEADIATLGLSPKSFYSARDIYSFTGERSVRTSWEKNGPKPAPRPRDEAAKTSEYNIQNPTTKAMLARAVRPEKVDMEQRRGLNEQPTLRRKPTTFPSNLDVEGKNSPSSDQLQEASELKGKSPDEEVSYVEEAEEVILARPGSAYSELPDEALELEHEEVEEATPVALGHTKNEAMPIERLNDMAALVRARKQTMSNISAAPRGNILFGSPFMAKYSQLWHGKAMSKPRPPAPSTKVQV